MEFRKYQHLERFGTQGGWSSKNIPQLLNTVFYDVVPEETWNVVKDLKNPTINFRSLQHFVFTKVKQAKQELF